MHALKLLQMLTGAHQHTHAGGYTGVYTNTNILKPAYMLI